MKTSILFLALGLSAAPPEMTVFKTKTCGCCAKWVEHMRAKGFKLTVNEVPSTAPYQASHGVPAKLGSCHTATIAGYTIEGHVPAEDVQRLLKEKPKAKGLSAPGMPMGSPGMEGARRDAYAVVLFGGEDGTKVYHQYPGD